MPEHDLEVGEVLQSHQARHGIKTIRLARFRIDCIGQSIHHFFLLNATTCCNLLDQGRLSTFSLVGGHIGPQISNNQGLKSIGDSFDLFVGPVNALIF